MLKPLVGFPHLLIEHGRRIPAILPVEPVPIPVQRQAQNGIQAGALAAATRCTKDTPLTNYLTIPGTKRPDAVLRQAFGRTRQ